MREPSVGQKPKTLVEINGKKYDAITGQPVADDTAARPQTPTAVQTDRRPAPATAKHSIGGLTPPTRPSKTPANHSQEVHKRTSKSHSLHRGAVIPQTARPAPADQHDKSHDEQPEPTRRRLAQNVDSARLERSAKHKKSSAIVKFSAGQPAAKVHAQTQMQSQVPSQTSPVAAAQAVTSPALSAKEELIAKRLAQTATHQPDPRAAKKPLASRIADKLKHGRGGSVVAVSLAALLLIGYVTYLNVPRMALRVAAGRAGFAAELPGYVPSGFRFSGPVAYSPGELILQYTSNTDDRYYEIREQETDWDSKTLLDNYVLGETDVYSTYQERGLTIYMFEGSRATWVNGGIWYTIGGDGELTSEQLLKIAASL